MRINRIVIRGVALALLLSCAAVPAWADRERGDSDRRGDVRGDKDRRDTPSHMPPGYVHDNRYHHDRYYPPSGHVVPVLPHDYRVVPYRGVKYRYHGGVWYSPFGARFTVVLPPVGIVVPVLPPFYTTIWVGGLPYYYAGGVHYVWRPDERGYVVTEAPPESEVREQPDRLFAYPMKGQSEQQQATDRYRCHGWAAEQAGWDPTQPGGNVPESQRAGKRAEYQRAMKACLEARGYSVK